MENIYFKNNGYDYWGTKIGSGAVGSYRGSDKFVNYMLFEKMILNWSEAKGMNVKFICIFQLICWYPLLFRTWTGICFGVGGDVGEFKTKKT